MRLINAGSLLANMDKGMQGTAREYLKFYQMAVNDEPTAYDVEKVVEQLDSYYEEEDEKGCYIPERIRMKVYDIVKAGGIDG